MSIKEHPPQHVPVLLDKTLELLHPKKGESYLDLTAGYGGHASAILEKTNNFDASVLVDRDENAIRELQSLADKGATLLHQDFLSAARELCAAGKIFDMILVDLGVSSPQLDKAERGFSFNNSGPLDMRMDSRQELTAKKLVNSAPEEKLARIICEYGEEPYSHARRIAEAIVQARPLETTGELSAAIERSYKGLRKKIHPATRTFQALRIHINDELTQVAELLPLLANLLAKDGRVGIISFHSLEDRLVKRYFVEEAKSGYEAQLRIVTKKPIEGSIYDVYHPRSRSAKLRVAAKI